MDFCVVGISAIGLTRQTKKQKRSFSHLQSSSWPLWGRCSGFRPKTVILPENCRLMVDTGEESLAEGMWIEDPEQKAQLLELLSAFRIRRYLSQPATDFPPGAGAEVWRLCKNRGLSAGHGPADRVLYRVSDPAVHGNLHRYFHPKALEADGPR